jgi:opacity protein-like surface antigen
MRLKRVMLVALLGFIVAAPAPARADWFFTPYIGANFAGDADDTNVNFGGSLGYMGAGILGAPIGGLGEGVRPYVSGGAGLLRARIDDVDDFFDVTDNSFGVNVGGGVMGFLTDNVGIRGDVRYFRSLQDEASGDDLDLDVGEFDFWRGSVGVAFRF